MDIWRSILQHPLSSEPQAGQANKFRHQRHPRECFIDSLRLSTFILTFHQVCHNLRLVHDTPPNRALSAAWYSLLV